MFSRNSRNVARTTLSLTKLDNHSVKELISKLAAPRLPHLSDSVSAKINQSSGGNPLYVEQLTEHYLERAIEEEAEQGTAEPDDLVPNLLQGSLMERIDKALIKIDDGTYGLCERCGKPIEKARLKALPYASLCLKDKQAEERVR